MAKLIDSVREVIEQVAIIQNLSVKEIIAGDDIPLPRMLPTGDGRTIIITREIDISIERIGRAIKENQSSILISHTDAEWTSAVRNALVWR